MHQVVTICSAPLRSGARGWLAVIPVFFSYSACLLDGSRTRARTQHHTHSETMGKVVGIVLGCILIAFAGGMVCRSGRRVLSVNSSDCCIVLLGCLGCEGCTGSDTPVCVCVLVLANRRTCRTTLLRRRGPTARHGRWCATSVPATSISASSSCWWAPRSVSRPPHRHQRLKPTKHSEPLGGSRVSWLVGGLGWGGRYPWMKGTGSHFRGDSSEGQAAIAIAVVVPLRCVPRFLSLPAGRAGLGARVGGGGA